MVKLNQNERLELVKEYLEEKQRAFYRLAYSYTKDRDAAMDVVQDAAVKAISKVYTLKNPDFLKTWFYRILVNEAITHLRRQKHISLDEQEEFLQAPPGKDIPEALDLYRAVQSLEPKLRTVIMLRFFEDMKLEEISKVTHTNLSTVKSRLYKGLHVLRCDMKE